MAGSAAPNSTVAASTTGTAFTFTPTAAAVAAASAVTSTRASPSRRMDAVTAMPATMEPMPWKVAMTPRNSTGLSSPSMTAKNTASVRPRASMVMIEAVVMVRSTGECRSWRMPALTSVRNRSVGGAGRGGRVWMAASEVIEMAKVAASTTATVPPPVEANRAAPSSGPTSRNDWRIVVRAPLAGPSDSAGTIWWTRPFIAGENTVWDVP